MLSIRLTLWIMLVKQNLLVKTATIIDTTLQNELSTMRGIVIDETTVNNQPIVAPTVNNEETDTSLSLADDVIELNIGGQRITTLRSTLTVIADSKLAKMFSKENSMTHLPTDKQGAVFFDYNPIYFNYLLDQLRAIKRLPKQPDYFYQFQAPYISSQVNFTHMLVDLGLTPDDLLSPREGTHANLTVSSLVGWKQCYRSTYDQPFDVSTLKKSCNGSQILVACRSVDNSSILTLAGIGEMEDMFHPCLPKECPTNGKPLKKKNRKPACTPNYQCITQGKRGVGWYNANNQTLGFVRGSLSFTVNPCDSSSLDSDYRLCWTSQTVSKEGTGDRCGSVLNIQKSNKWERLIYYVA